MKPETYKYYAAIFDRFSDERLFPQNLQFVLKVLKQLSRGGKIADVGGGTGYFTSKMLSLFPYVQLTFIEPSPEMMAIARTRLPRETVFIEGKFDEVLAGLEAMDLFIFQRSLYSFYSDLADYRDLAGRLYLKTAAGGRIAIYEIEAKYDLGVIENYLTATRESFEISDREFS